MDIFCYNLFYHDYLSIQPSEYRTDFVKYCRCGS